MFDREKSGRKGLIFFFFKWYCHEVKLMKEKEQIFRECSNSASESQGDRFLRDGK